MHIQHYTVSFFLVMLGLFVAQDSVLSALGLSVMHSSILVWGVRVSSFLFMLFLNPIPSLFRFLHGVPKFILISVTALFLTTFVNSYSIMAFTSNLLEGSYYLSVFYFLYFQIKNISHEDQSFSILNSFSCVMVFFGIITSILRVTCSYQSSDTTANLLLDFASSIPLYGCAALLTLARESRAAICLLILFFICIGIYNTDRTIILASCIFILFYIRFFSYYPTNFNIFMISIFFIIISYFTYLWEVKLAITPMYSSESFSSGRSLIWGAQIEVLRFLGFDNIFLGAGPDLIFPDEFFSEYPYFEYLNNSYIDLEQPHSTFVATFVQFGILGIVCLYFIGGLKHHIAIKKKDSFMPSFSFMLVCLSLNSQAAFFRPDLLVSYFLVLYLAMWSFYPSDQSTTPPKGAPD